jgi:Domain of unknown function (DUF222)
MTAHCVGNAALRSLLSSGELGQHNGLPTSIVVTTTLKELEAKVGTAVTGGGTLLPMSDVIRLASQAHHYLAIFDKGSALALYHTKRLASPAQRIVLYAKERLGYAPLGGAAQARLEPDQWTMASQSTTKCEVLAWSTMQDSWRPIARLGTWAGGTGVMIRRISGARFGR